MDQCAVEDVAGKFDLFTVTALAGIHRSGIVVRESPFRNIPNRVAPEFDAKRSTMKR
jgi:hypothetical protein